MQKEACVDKLTNSKHLKELMKLIYSKACKLQTFLHKFLHVFTRWGLEHYVFKLCFIHSVSFRAYAVFVEVPVVIGDLEISFITPAVITCFFLHQLSQCESSYKAWLALHAMDGKCAHYVNFDCLPHNNVPDQMIGSNRPNCCLSADTLFCTSCLVWRFLTPGQSVGERGRRPREWEHSWEWWGQQMTRWACQCVLLVQYIVRFTY